jgi:hypothetical protein
MAAPRIIIGLGTQSINSPNQTMKLTPLLRKFRFLVAMLVSFPCCLARPPVLVAQLVLVRSMSRVAIFAFLIAFAGCATQLQIVGPYANQLSQADIQQITALITPSKETSHLYTRLEAVRSNEVLVKYGGYRRSIEGVYTPDASSEYFTAFKRNGRWIAGGEFGMESTVTVY